MQVNRRTSGAFEMNGAVRVSSVVWVREKQLDKRTGGVLVMKGEVQVSSAIWGEAA